mmetsp:Transcript_39217/g.94378  ORF Transcript_39217/g.94378 Transcript_39217/m.94378 type:complete len:292 (+) Transcript_39217:1359-2234(+)
MSAEPTFPVPPSIATLSCVWESVNAMCAALSARLAWLASTTTATCRSEDPCAMTRMFTFALASELMKLADTPDCIAMPSPTMATIAMGLSVSEMEFTFDLEISSSNVDRSAPRAAPPWFSGTTTVMLDSELAWVTISTSMSASAMDPMNRSATSAPPITLAPSSVRRDTASTDVMPLMGISPLLLFQFLTFPSLFASLKLEQRPWMTVPSNPGLKIFRTYTGMFESMHGTIALGCRTWAPKYASSMASSYLREDMLKASGTRRGSAVYTPSVFFHMVTRAEPTSFAKMVAE